MRKAILLLPLALAACGGESPMTAATPVISLQAAGAAPAAIAVQGGAQLSFVNSDAVDHRIVSTDCSELSSPTLAAGATFTATLGTGPKTCSFGDALQPSAAFQGTVSVQTAAVGGTGNPYGY